MRPNCRAGRDEREIRWPSGEVRDTNMFERQSWDAEEGAEEQEVDVSFLLDSTSACRGIDEGEAMLVIVKLAVTSDEMSDLVR